MVTEGLMTIDDVQVVKYTHRYLHPLPADRPVSEVMTREVVTLTSDMPIARAWEYLLKNLVKAAPVVDAQGHVVGVLTDEDLLTRADLGQRLAVAERMDQHLVDEELQRLRQSPLTVANVMTQPAITTRPKEPLGIAAARMTRARIKRFARRGRSGETARHAIAGGYPPAGDASDSQGVAATHCRRRRENGARCDAEPSARGPSGRQSGRYGKYTG